MTKTPTVEIPAKSIIETATLTNANLETPVPTKTLVAIVVSPSNSPKPTQILPTTAPTASISVIIETAKIIDTPVQQVEKVLRNSTEIIPLGLGEAEEVPDGGESRTYQVGKYTIWVTYDKKGIAKGLQIVDGLLADGYSLDQWGVILTRIGVNFVELPDVVAPAARRWTNIHGYAIMITAEKIGGNVWTVRIYKIPS